MRVAHVPVGLSLAVAIVAAGAPTVNFAWPWFMLVRGGGLAEPVVVGLGGNDGNRDIIGLYASLHASPPTTDYTKRPYYEVAEFWGSDYVPDANGRPLRPLRFESVGTYAKIYRGTASQPPVWVGRSRGVAGIARVIGDEGRRILERAGLKLR